MMTEVAFHANIEARYECIDVFPIKWYQDGSTSRHSQGILLEIWRTGGLLQTCVPLPEGSPIELAPTGHAIQARVARCDQDDYGFMVCVSVNSTEHDKWFPQSYRPPYLRSHEQHIK